MKENTAVRRIIIYIFGGLVCGMLNGMLGAGGGLIAVPVLEYILHDGRRAHATALAVILPVTVFSSAIYLISGRVKIADTVPYLLPGILGAIVGAWLLRHIPVHWIHRIFGILMLISAVRTFLK